MAVVYEVVDAQRGRVALKRPRKADNPEQGRRLHELFAREFHTLSQLAHPRIVQVHDYGVDDSGPYYTMELLDGGDLQQTVPSDHLRVCAAARDICSALSLLHSRRMVHRDISPRNVRCTADGTAKLIDFGAMTMMGPAKELVGTPVYCAPEMLNRQQLDGRADLYALGATLYYVLTGRHAYPVREFASLSSAWSFGFPRPSELVPGIPAALDALVLDLLQLDPNDRPRSAAEVMERLAVIEGKPLDEHLLVAQAYLSSPAFVGRDSELEQIRERMLHKRGGAFLIHGPAGVGRTRLLDAALLAGKLQGVMPLRADADDASREHGVAGALLSQLVRLAPDAVRAEAGEDLPLLAAVVPELGAPRPSAASTEVQAALRRLLLGISRRGALAIGVDDFARIDEASAALLALLARDVRKARVTIVVTIESAALAQAGRVGPDGRDPSHDYQSPALRGGSIATQRLFAEAAQHIGIENLSLPATQSILGSVFGESPELEPLVRRLFAIAHGNPRDLMRLAQHLVDHGVVRYQAGAWVLPARFDIAELPSSVSQILSHRVRQLSSSARALARAWALCPEQSLSEADCASLADHAKPAQLMRDLEQLVQADILVSASERMRFRDRTWVAMLLADLSPAETTALHLRVARMFEQRGGEGFRVGQHLLRAGERPRALDEFVAHAIASQAMTDSKPEEFYRLVSSMPADWQSTYEEVLQLCQELKRPLRDRYAVVGRLNGLIAVASLHNSRHLADLIVNLRRWSGLDDWAALDPTMPPGPRLMAAMQQAQARFAATPEHERVLDPGAAVRALTRAVSDSVGLAAQQLDLAALLALPSLEPFVPLGPMIGVIHQTAEGARARLSGRVDRTREIYVGVIERTRVAENAGLGETHRRIVYMGVTGAMAMVEASMGLASSLDGARALETESHYRPNAVLVRMLHELFQGNVLEADRHRRRVEVLRLEAHARQAAENSHLVWQTIAFAAMEDLTRLKRVVEELENAPKESVGWQHVHAYARAEYQRVRGDLPAAELELSAQLAEIRAGDHQLWAYAAGALVQVLSELGRLDEAVSAGRRYLEQAEQAQLGFGDCFVRMPLAVAEARSGLPDAAQHADHVIRRFLELEVTGLNLGLACEARARVALEQADQAAYDAYSLRCSEEYMRAGNPALSARYQRLRRAAQQKSLVTVPPHADAPVDRQADPTRFKERLGTCQNRDERAQAALALLAEHTGVGDGFLYHVSAEGPVLVAAQGRLSKPPENLNAMVRDYLAGESGAGETTGETTETTHRTDWSSLGEALYRPVLLSHYVDEGFAITGIAVFSVGPEQAFAYPRDAAIQLSQLASDMGDVTSLVISEG